VAGFGNQFEPAGDTCGTVDRAVPITMLPSRRDVTKSARWASNGQYPSSSSWGGKVKI
jgi:hypothetical protein